MNNPFLEWFCDKGKKPTSSKTHILSMDKSICNKVVVGFSNEEDRATCKRLNMIMNRTKKNRIKKKLRKRIQKLMCHKINVQMW